MNPRISSRVSALKDLVELRRPIAESMLALAQFGWDSQVELIELSLLDFVRVLDNYLNGSLTSEEVEMWAEALIGRDDVGLQKGAEDVLRTAMFEYSTPTIHEPITPISAAAWRARFESLIESL